MKTGIPQIMSVLAAAAALAVPAFGQNTPPAQVSHADRDFFDQAAVSSTNAVSISQLAANHAADPDVKSLAETMITDHTQLNADLTALSRRRGLNLSADVQKGQSDVDGLRRKNGEDFDKAYLEAVADAQRKLVSAFEQEAAESQDKRVAAFATRSLSSLIEDLRAAEALYRKVAGTNP